MCVVFTGKHKRLFKMQASTFTVKGNTGFGLQNRRILKGVGDLRSRTLALNSLRMTGRSSCFGVSVDSASMGIELGRARRTVQSVFGSSAKSRSHIIRASGTCHYSPFGVYVLNQHYSLIQRMYIERGVFD